MESTRTGANSQDQQSYSSLLSSLLQDVQELFRGEVRLAKAEARENVAALARGIALIAAAAILALVGLTILMIGLSVLATEWLEDWQAFALVGAVILVVAVLAGLFGKSRLSGANLAPDRTVGSLKEDKEWASQQIKSLRS